MFFQFQNSLTHKPSSLPFKELGLVTEEGTVVNTIYAYSSSQII